MRTEFFDASNSEFRDGSIVDILGTEVAERLSECTTADQEAQILSATVFDEFFCDRSNRAVIEHDDA